MIRMLLTIEELDLILEVSPDFKLEYVYDFDDVEKIQEDLVNQEILFVNLYEGDKSNIHYIIMANKYADLFDMFLELLDYSPDNSTYTFECINRFQQSKSE